jgi:hypothetical protein
MWKGRFFPFSSWNDMDGVEDGLRIELHGIWVTTEGLYI